MLMRIQIPRPITLTKLINLLAEKYGVNRRPLRYFDVEKRGELTDSEIKKVKTRFEELVAREICVKTDPTNPICYTRVKSDTKAPKKQESSYKKDYEEIYRNHLSTEQKKYIDDESREFKKLVKKHLNVDVPLGVAKISLESGINVLVLKEVFNRAVGAYATSGSRTGMSAEQWGYGRVYSFIMCYFHNKNKKYSSRRFFQNKTDGDLLQLL
jgi:hypothetical protein